MTSLNFFAWYMTHCSWAEITAGKLFGLRRDIIIGISGECHKVIDAKIKNRQLYTINCKFSSVFSSFLSFPILGQSIRCML